MSQSPRDAPSISNTSRSHDTYSSVRKLSAQHIPHFRDQAHDTRALTKLVATCINALCHQYICAIFHCLSGYSHVSDLHKHNGRVLEPFKAGDDLAVRLEITVWGKEPHCCWAVLDYERQRRLLEVAHRAMTGYEAYSNWKRAIR
ncbi:hypothetical protein HG531_007970 [Fusarium graminearum]|nr:hypothetical protein HG531_007970 [Fusarium graminearum]